MHHSERVQMPNSTYDLRGKKPRSFAQEMAFLVQVVKQMSAVDKVHHQVQLLRSLQASSGLKTDFLASANLL